MGFGLTVQTFCLLTYDKEKHQFLILSSWNQEIFGIFP